MNQDELAFLNQQLAGMLRAGIPLEPALRQLCAEMGHGRWRRELEALAARLEAGEPLEKAVAAGQFPPLYRQMLVAGARGGELPAVLNQLADHYRETGHLWMRVRAAAAYPLITLFGAALLSVGLLYLTALLANSLGFSQTADMWWDLPAFTQLFRDLSKSGFFAVLLLAPVLLLMGLGLTALAFLLIPALRRWSAWHLPVFREASLAKASGTVALALGQGVSLAGSLGLAEALDPGSAAAVEWRRWREAVESGNGKAADFAATQRVFPKVFGWLLVSSGEDLRDGFRQATEVFGERARANADRMVMALTPVLLLFVGVVLVAQLIGAMRVLSDVLPWIHLTS